MKSGSKRGRKALDEFYDHGAMGCYSASAASASAPDADKLLFWFVQQHKRIQDSYAASGKEFRHNAKFLKKEGGGGRMDGGGGGGK